MAVIGWSEGVGKNEGAEMSAPFSGTTHTGAGPTALKGRRSYQPIHEVRTNPLHWN